MIKKLIFLFISLNIIKAYPLIHPHSFIGSWSLNDNLNKRIIHLSKCGSIYKSTNNINKYIGHWEIKKNEFNFIISDLSIQKIYEGYIYANSLNVYGKVCEGVLAPCYYSNFSMLPLFDQFHNISYIDNKPELVYLNRESCLGKWILENINTNQIYIIELFKNNKWKSVNKSIKLNGRWNLFNDTEEINLNSVLDLSGTNIWLGISNQKNQSYINFDITFIGKIIKLTNLYYYDENIPSSENKNDKLIVSSKINGSVCYGFDMDGEMSEKFYMKRWFD